MKRALDHLRRAQKGLANNPSMTTALALQRAQRAFQMAKRKNIRLVE